MSDDALPPCETLEAAVNAARDELSRAWPDHAFVVLASRLTDPEIGVYLAADVESRLEVIAMLGEGITAAAAGLMEGEAEADGLAGSTSRALN